MLDLRRKTELGTRKSRETWFSRIAGIFRRSAFSDEMWDELEELLVSADVGVETAATLLQRVRGRVKVEKLSEPSEIREALKREMIALLAVRSPGTVAPTDSASSSTTLMSTRQPGSIKASGAAQTGLRKGAGQDDYVSTKESPQIILVVGVNGSGKTTSVAKLAYSLTSQQRRVVLAAADTFRAAAIEQLKHWG
ncbi:MAG: signal recognition particle receptor subunit alpha, partial [Dehalococcoidia bacterium]